MSQAAFGNDPAKTESYRAFWARDDVRRPLVGFSLVGWFPIGEFAACRRWTGDWVSPEMVDPAEFLDDHERMIGEGERVDDDLIRGAGPTQVAVPFVPGIIGCRIRLLPQNAMGVERNLTLEGALKLSLDPENPWYRKYMEFADALAERSAGRFPVSHGAEIGPTDMHAVLRGHSTSIGDLIDEPERTAELLARMGGIFRDLNDALWSRLPQFHGGWFDGQYSLWAPGPIARLQEDAIAVYSPTLYRELVQPVDRMLAAHYPCAFMHLHSTSMFLLDGFLEIEELRCFEINLDDVGPPVATMVPHFQAVQKASRSLVVRGSVTPEDLRLLVDSLEPRGLMLLIMVKDMAEIERLRPLVGM